MYNSFTDFKVIEAMKTSLNKMEKEVNSDEVEEIKRLVNKYDVISKDDVEEKELIMKYETCYDKLYEYLLNKRKQINNIDGMITTLSEFSPDENFATIINKKKDTVNQIIDCINQIIDCINQIVERIKQLETTIYNNKVEKLNDMKVERYGIMKQPMKQVQIQQPITNSDLMIVLKQWSNKKKFNVIFNSDIYGDGSNNVLHDRVFNKSNLYFISFDGENNVYGGYLNTKIESDNWIYDENAFTFSLIRNGKVNNKRYFLKQGKDSAFRLGNNHPDGYLYRFGNDISVWKVGSNESCFFKNKYCYYEYNNDNKPLTDTTYPRTHLKYDELL